MFSVPSALFHSQILDACHVHADLTALTDAESGRSLTFNDVRKQSYEAAAACRRVGMRKGDIVLCMLPNCLEYPVLFLGLALNGAALSGVPPDATHDEFAYFEAYSESRFLVKSRKQTVAWETSMNIVDVEWLLEQQESAQEELDEIEITPDTVLLAPFSSGTTGRPKCALLTHDNYSAVTAALKQFLFDDLDRRRQSTVAMLPFYHASGFWSMLLCIINGHHTIVMRTFNMGRMIELVVQYNISIINTIPSIVSYLVRVPVDMPTLRVVLCGSAALGKELTEALITRHPSIEHLIQGRGVMRSYLRVGSPLDENGWLRTGDVMRRDGDGFYFVVDRIKDVFKVHGKQEDVLLTHPKVAEAAVVGVPDAHAGHLPKAFIVLSEKIKDFAYIVREVELYVKARLSPLKHIKGGIHVVASLPRSASGKVLRRLLLEQNEDID